MKTIKVNRGFTVIELMVGLAIMGILLAISIPLYNNYKANLQLKKEAKLFESFLKRVRMTAREKCVDVTLTTASTISMPGAVHASFTTKASQIIAANTGINYSEVFQGSDGTGVASKYDMANVMTVTNNGYVDSGSNVLNSLTFYVMSQVSTKVYQVDINNAGVTSVQIRGASDASPTGTE